MCLTQLILHLRKKVLVLLQFCPFILVSDLSWVSLSTLLALSPFFKSVMFLSEHKRQIMFEKYEKCGELRAKILSRFFQNCVFSPPSKSFLRLSTLSIWMPCCKQTEFFSLQDDLVGVEPATSIHRLTAVCFTNFGHVWYYLRHG